MTTKNTLIIISLNEFVLKMLKSETSPSSAMTPIITDSTDYQSANVQSSRQCYRRRHQSQSQHHSQSSRKSSSIFSTSNRTNAIQWILIMYIITILPTVTLKPISNTTYHNDKRFVSHPKWVNPCGIRSNHVSNENGSELKLVPRLSDSILLQQIIAQARIAFREADSFKEEYVKKIFEIDFKTHHAMWKPHTVKWLLPETVPKTLHEKTNDTHLSKLELDDSLLEIYKYLQRVAVGLEQVVWNQEDHKGPFEAHFKDIDYKLRALLCEIHVAILERGLAVQRDESRDVMGPEHRASSSRLHNNLRDWLIFRDYMNSLEYVIDVFEYFKLKMRRS